MVYNGEHLLIGHLGNLCVALSFVGSLGAAIAWLLDFRGLYGMWKQVARNFFKVHILTTCVMMIVLLIMMANRYYEYQYVWEHTNNIMPMRYLLAAFWEGQQGSFMLWLFWQALLGIILMRSTKNMESAVMMTYALVQAFLASMILGVNIFGLKLGSNPFVTLLREVPENIGLPIFNDPGYLLKIDGRGLNPLLQNYWMTIHPPTLFLGFAACLPVFSYSIGALLKREYHGAALAMRPWAFFAVGILGAGVLMGGAWAYEALSFGGFWAWDPVENASLVPWLVITGAAHLMLMKRKENNNSAMLFGLSLLAYLLVLYSTFLTRSGILGDSSVHAFTDLGINAQLIAFVAFFTICSIVIYIVRVKDIVKGNKEDPLLSREFWMLVGALVLLCSAMQITATTSIPVFNKIFSTNMAQPEDVYTHFHKFQIFFAVLICIFMGWSQYLRYGKNDRHRFWRSVLWSTLITAALTAGLTFVFGLDKKVISYSIFGMQLNSAHPGYILLLFSIVYAGFVNASYFIRVLKGKVLKAGSSIAHVGFAIMMMGILVSTGTQKVLSENTSGVDIDNLGDEINNREHILLYKNDTLPMGRYRLTYTGRRQESINLFFPIDYLVKEGDKVQKAFTLRPRLQLNARMGNVPEPDTRHFINKDIYTHVTYAQIKRAEGDFETSLDDTAHLDDIIRMRKGDIRLETMHIINNDSTLHLGKTDTVEAIRIGAFVHGVKIDEAVPMRIRKDSNGWQSLTYTIDSLSCRITLNALDTAAGAAWITVEERTPPVRDFVIMKAIVFPWINLLWMGCFLMVIGTFIAVYNRMRYGRRK